MLKIALFVFNGDPMCFIHVLLNSLDLSEKGYSPQIVIEGSATKLIPELAKKDHALHTLWEKVKNKDLVAGVCKACSNKMGTLQDAVDQKLIILDDMSGHPGMAGFKENGYEIMTF